MAQQHDPLYDLRDDDPARFEAVDGDLMDVRLIADDDMLRPVYVSNARLFADPLEALWLNRFEFGTLEEC